MQLLRHLPPKYAYIHHGKKASPQPEVGPLIIARRIHDSFFLSVQIEVIIAMVYTLVYPCIKFES